MRVDDGFSYDCELVVIESLRASLFGLFSIGYFSSETAIKAKISLAILRFDESCLGSGVFVIR